MNEYQVLSSIYRLLGDSSEELLDKIERTSEQPKEILDVVQALKKALVAMDVKYRELGVGRKKGVAKSATDIGFGIDQRAWSAHAKKLWNSLQMALSDPKSSDVTNHEIVEAFVKFGLETKARGKDGRKKMFLIIQASLDTHDDAKRVRVLQNVLGILGLNQTKGWIEVIKSKSRD